MKIAIIAGALAVLLAGTGANSSDTDDKRARNEAGERAFQRCYACHALEDSGGSLDGPDLNRIVGRPIASEPDFAYSEALRNFAASNERWTTERLDRFLADPQAEVPGNAMGFFGIADATERAALIAFLAEQENP